MAAHLDEHGHRLDDVTVNGQNLTHYRWKMLAKAELDRLGCCEDLIFDSDLTDDLGTDEAWQVNEDPVEWANRFVQTLP